METGLNAGPPPLLEHVVRRLIPPMVREEVAGDLWERFESPARYVADAVGALPFLIVSQVRRAANGSLLVLHAFTIFAAFGGFEPTLGLSAVSMWQRALVATLPALAALLLRDAYRANDHWTARRAAGDLVAVLLAVLIGEGLVALLSAHGLVDPYWRISGGFLIGGLLFSTTVIFVLRTGADLAPRTPPGSPAWQPDVVERDYRQFRRNLGLRNAAEIGATSILLASMVLYSLYAIIPLVAKVALAWVVLAIPALGFMLLRAQTQPMPQALAPADQLAFYRRELAHQRDRLGLGWWLCFGPLFAGLGLNMIVRGLMKGWSGLALVGCVTIAALAVMIARADHVRRRQLSAKIAALDRLERLRPG